MFKPEQSTFHQVARWEREEGSERDESWRGEKIWVTSDLFSSALCLFTPNSQITSLYISWKIASNRKHWERVNVCLTQQRLWFWFWFSVTLQNRTTRRWRSALYHCCRQVKRNQLSNPTNSKVIWALLPSVTAPDQNRTWWDSRRSRSPSTLSSTAGWDLMTLVFLQNWARSHQPQLFLCF